jgi:ubiquinone/menaquinone biosynthesis C-methylase UbiE
MLTASYFSVSTIGVPAMFLPDTDREWEEFGATDPYFGVITFEEYRQANLSDENKEAFFRSGYDYIADVSNKIRKHIDPAFNPKRCLEFGCGVGRLVIPLAEISEYVVGLDVSESMLNEARKNCESRSVKNVDFLRTNDDLSSLSGKYDFIHSFIVFQHIPVRRGWRILGNLLARLEKGGICVLHFTYAKNYRPRHFVSFIKHHVPFGKNLINLIRGRTFFAPVIQMNTYDLNKIFLMMQKINVRDFYAEYTDHAGDLGLLIYFKRAGEKSDD